MSSLKSVPKDMDKTNTTNIIHPMEEDFDVGEVITKSPSTTSKVQEGEYAEAFNRYQPDTAVEKKMLRKVDLYLLPMLWIMCVLAYVDRNNIANANAAGMGEDIGLSDNKYAMLVSIFFIAYCFWEVPSNLILSRVRPSYYLPSLMLIWGAIVCVMSEVDTYQHILVCRFFLGIIEAGFFPGVLYIFTCWYKKAEIGKRWCFFYTALCFSGAASGLISGAVISGLEGVNGRRGWRWLFLIEGIVTIGVAVVAHFVLLDYPHIAGRRFTEEERQVAVVRIMKERSESTNVKRKLTAFESVKAAVVDLRVYVFVVLFQMQNASTTVSYFIPTVLGSMGYAGVQKQWMTVPIWAVGVCFLLVFPYLSDRTGNRQYFIVGGLSTAFISSIICVSQQHDIVRYVFLCFYIAGLYMTLPLILNWASELMGRPAEKRAVVIAMVNCMGSISSIYGSYLWPSRDAPKYIKGFATVSAFLGADIILALTLPIIARHLPKFTTKAEREIEAEE